MSTSPEIDITFDFRSDANGRDPDSYSPTLKRYHGILWSKPTRPGEPPFELVAGGRGYLRHESEELGNFIVSSDTIATSHRRRLRHFYSQLSDAENADFHRRGYTIGGSIVFPLRSDGGQSMNQRRGLHHSIQDRFDLTLECIRRHYDSPDEVNPLPEPIGRYADFFELFGSFVGYVEFFHLQDLIDDRGSIKWLHEFDDFRGAPLPKDLDSYVAYRERTLQFVDARNLRIADSQRRNRLDAGSPAADSHP